MYDDSHNYYNLGQAKTAVGEYLEAIEVIHQYIIINSFRF